LKPLVVLGVLILGVGVSEFFTSLVGPGVAVFGTTDPMGRKIIQKVQRKLKVWKALLQLNSQDWDVQLAAIQALETWQAREVIPALIQRLTDEKPWVREAAFQALERLHAREEAIPALIQRLADEGRYERRAAIWALGRWQAREAIPALIQHLTDEIWWVRGAAIQALETLQAREAIPALILRLADEKWEVRRAAIRVLRTWQASEAIPALIQRRADENPEVQAAARTALQTLKGTPENIPGLIALLHDPPTVRQAAIRALETLQAREAIPALIQHLTDWNSGVRWAAIEALGTLHATEAIPALRQRATDRSENEEIREAAREALNKLTSTPGVLPWDLLTGWPALLTLGWTWPLVLFAVLVITLTLTRPSARQSPPTPPWPTLKPLVVLGVLLLGVGLAGFFTSLVVPELAVFGTTDPTGGKIIRKIRRKLKIWKTLRQLTSQDRKVQVAAIEALGTLQATEAIPALIQRLTGGWSEVVRQAAIRVLETWQAREEVISALIPRLTDERWGVRRAAIQLLWTLQAREAIPALIPRLTDGEWGVRRVAIEALKRLEATEAIPALVQRLTDERWEVRWAASQALGTLQAREAIPALVQRLTDENMSVREAASEALKKLKPTQSVLPLDLLTGWPAVLTLGWVWPVVAFAVGLVITLIFAGHSSRQSPPAMPWSTLKPLIVLGLLILGVGLSEFFTALVGPGVAVFGTTDPTGGKILQKVWRKLNVWRTVKVRKALRHLNSQDGDVRQAAIGTLSALQATEAIPALIHRLTDKDGAVRLVAIWVLETWQAREAIPALLQRLTDEVKEVRQAAIEALRTLPAREVIPALLQRLADENWEVRVAAMWALETLPAREAIPALLQRLTDEDRRVREAAIRALKTLNATEAIPALLERLTDKSAGVRQTAIEALVRLQAREAIPALRQRATDPSEDEATRQAAEAAVKKLTSTPVVLPWDLLPGWPALLTLGWVWPVVTFIVGLLMIRLFGRGGPGASVPIEDILTHDPQDHPPAVPRLFVIPLVLPSREALPEGGKSSSPILQRMTHAFQGRRVAYQGV
ncbi:MAG: HEAT repeat domain-containing protein, partial [Elusimicrobia bacterium]|nr:HEAT repeat domain-containing protein [Elusimicrobiota bacterium]